MGAGEMLGWILFASLVLGPIVWILSRVWKLLTGHDVITGERTRVKDAAPPPPQKWSKTLRERLIEADRAASEHPTDEQTDASASTQ
jgi:hypothetical protein